jgi:hypothetical protein
MELNKDRIKELIVEYLKKNGVIKASLFGSFVRNESDDDSDIDLIVKFQKGKSLLDLVGLRLDLEERFNRKVDILTYDSIHPKLREQILSEQEVIYEEKS